MNVNGYYNNITTKRPKKVTYNKGGTVNSIQTKLLKDISGLTSSFRNSR